MGLTLAEAESNRWRVEMADKTARTIEARGFRVELNTGSGRPATWDARSVYCGSLDGTLSAIQSPSYLRAGLVLFSQLRQHCPVDQADVRN